MIPEQTMRRLAFVRYLYSQGVEQSRRPYPHAAVSLLTFHDAVELFLVLAYEHLNAHVKGEREPAFMDYWKLLRRRVPPDGLSQESSMQRVNKARVSLKHRGVLPSSLDLESYRASVTSFFEENTPAVFELELSSISMIELVQCAGARNELTEAQTLAQRGNVEEALAKIALGFAVLIDDYEDRKRGGLARSPFFFGRSFAFLSGFYLRVEDRKLREFFDNASDALESLREAVKILALGIDYRRYAKFRALTPGVHRTLGGYMTQEAAWDTPPGPAAYEYCLDFAIESAMRIQECDWALDDEEDMGRRRWTIAPPRDP